MGTGIEGDWFQTPRARKSNMFVGIVLKYHAHIES